MSVWVWLDFILHIYIHIHLQPCYVCRLLHTYIFHCMYKVLHVALVRLGAVSCNSVSYFMFTQNNFTKLLKFVVLKKPASQAAAVYEDTWSDDEEEEEEEEEGRR